MFGYYIEVSKSFLDSVPYRYTRKQTLVNAERFITEELKEIENKVLGASEEAAAIENRIFGELVGACMDEIASLQRTARALATLDVLVSLATVAVRNNYVKPVIGKRSRQSTYATADIPSSKPYSRTERMSPTIPCSTATKTAP